VKKREKVRKFGACQVLANKGYRNLWVWWKNNTEVFRLSVSLKWPFRVTENQQEKANCIQAGIKTYILFASKHINI